MNWYVPSVEHPGRDRDLKEKPVVKRLLRKHRETLMYLDVVGRWSRRVKNVKRVV